MDDKNYHIDGVPADFKDIIRKAKEYGYDGVILLTSEAARTLRGRGHTVGNISELVEVSK